MDISVFLTQKAAAGTGKAPSSVQSLTGGNGIFSGIASANFMDLIFARLTAEAQATGTTKKAEPSLSQGKIISAEKGASSITPEITTNIMPAEQITALPAMPDQVTIETAAPEIPAVSAASGTPLATEISAEFPLQTAAFTITSDLSSIPAPDQNQALTLGTFTPSAPSHDNKKLSAFLDGLLQGTPQEGAPVVISLNPGKIKNILAQAQGEKDLPFPALIATGLTPEQLTEIIEDIADGNEQGEAFILGLVKIMPPESKKETIFLPRGIIVTPQQPSTGETTPAPSEGGGTTDNDSVLASKLNALNVGGDEDLSAEEGSDFEDILRVLEKAQENAVKTGQQDGTKGLETAIGKIRQHMQGQNPLAAAVAATIPGAHPAPHELSTDFLASAVYPEGWDFATSSVHGLNITGPAQLTSLVGHVQQAGLPHPATQIVASVIARTSASGESKNITIQLDPPDLGKVSVRMEFHKDGNKMKAVLIAEKPETFLMLQRDSHALERSLHEAGIDTDGGLSFELSQDGSAFSHDHHSTGGNSGGGNSTESGSDSGLEMEITETRMDWYVDPQTGIARYDALV